MFFPSLTAGLFASRKDGAGRSHAKRRSFSVESLESRIAMANDFFVVPGAAGTTVTVTFDWVGREAAYQNEIGFYQVTDDSGRINGLAPGDSNYARTVQQNGTVLFASGTGAGQKVNLTFAAGQRLGFFLIQNNNLTAWRGNGNNKIGEGAIAFFSFDAANPDNFDHVRSTASGATGKLFSFEDLTRGGDQDFNDAIIRVDLASTSTLPAATLGLDRASDSGTVGDQVTNASAVTLNGTTGAGATVELVGLNRTTIADASGKFSFANVALANGLNEFTVRTSTSTTSRENDFTIIRQNQAPTFANPGAVQLFRGLAPADQTKVAVDVRAFFLDADINNSLVRLNTNEGNVDIELFDTQAPMTVANFLNYVESGAYNNSIFHRSPNPDFVLQGGNNRLNGTAPNASLPEIAENPAVLNEFSASRSNLQWTVAMAKRGPASGQQPNNQTINSATNNFFVNLVNNSSNLDSQNGGFTAFGQVTADTRANVTNLAAIPIENRGSGFESLPIQNFSGSFPGNLTPDNLAYINSATVVRQVEDLIFSVESITNVTNGPVTATVDNNRIILNLPATGAVSATLTIRATDRAGASVVGVFTVNVT